MKQTLRIMTLVLCFIPGLARADAEPDYQQWVQLYAEGNLDTLLPGLRLGLDLHARRGNAPLLCDPAGCSPSPNTLLIVRPSVGYALSPKHALWLGYAWVPNLFDDPLVRGARNTHEHRIWEQYSGRFVFGRAELGIRTRLEHRFRSAGPGEGDVAHRLRQLVRFAYTLSSGKPWLVIFTDELFLHLSESGYRTEPGLDQNRAFLGLGYQANPDFRVEMGYMNHYVHRYTDANQLNHVFSLNVVTRFGFPLPAAPSAPPAPGPEPEPEENALAPTL
jgi:hypothetical protein